jgi:DNA-binding NarL/FixJ family response regulator
MELKNSTPLAPEFTDHEQQIISMISNGKGSKEIADVLNVTDSFVRQKIWALRLRFKCDNTSHLMATLFRKGLIQ